MAEPNPPPYNEKGNAPPEHDPLMPQEGPPPQPYPPPQGQYPPQGAYPPPQGGYPPPQGGYPPQQGGYPPQQGQYPQAQGQYGPPPGQQTTIIYTQPQPTNVADHLGFSIFTMLCCCLCLGIAALIKSLNVQSANNRGDREEAERLSNEALKYNKIGLGIGICLNLVWVVVVILSFVLPGIIAFS